jgi:hypothetical protein
MCSPCAINLCALQETGIWTSNLASETWCTLARTRKYLNKHSSNWTWASNNFSNVPSCIYTPSSKIPMPTGNTSNRGKYVVIAGGPEDGNIYYVDMDGVANLVENNQKLGYLSNNFSNVPSCIYTPSSKIPMPTGNTSNRGKYVVIAGGPEDGNIYYVDMDGVANLVENNQKLGYLSNNFSNYAPSNAMSNWNFGSNIASWTSNALSNVPKCTYEYSPLVPSKLGNSNNLGKFVIITNGPELGNIYYVDMLGAANLVEDNAKLNYMSNNFSNYAMSNQLSNYAFSNGMSNWNYASNTASWTSNQLSNMPMCTYVYSSTVPSDVGNTKNLGKFVVIAGGPEDGNIYYIDMLGEANLVEDNAKMKYMSNNFSNYAMSNQLSNYAFSNGMSNWNYASNTASWTSNQLSNMPLCTYVYSSIVPSDLGNTKNLGKFVVITGGPEDGNIYYIDMLGEANLVEDSAKIKYGSNTASWTSNQLSNMPLCTYVYSSTIPSDLGNTKNLGKFVVITGGPEDGNIYYIDMLGEANLVEDNAKMKYMSNNFSNYAMSNQLSNYAFSNGMSNWNYASNTASWTSNQLSNMPVCTYVYSSSVPKSTGNTSNLGKFTVITSGPEAGNVYYTDMNGVAHMVEDNKTLQWLSNNTSNWIFASNTSTWTSNTATWTSNALSNISSKITYVYNASPPAASGNTTNLSKFVVITSGAEEGNIYFVDANGVAHLIEEPGCCEWTSNTAAWTSNNLGNIAGGIPDKVNYTYSPVVPEPIGNTTNLGKFVVITTGVEDGNIYYVDYNGVANLVEDTATAVWTSNQLSNYGTCTHVLDYTVPKLEGNTTNLGKFVEVTRGPEDGNIYYVDVNGVGKLIEDARTSNLTDIYYWLSNSASNWNWASNTAKWTSNALSNYAFSNGMSNWNWASNTASWTSNALSNYAFSNGMSNWNWASNTVNWASNTATWASNKASGTSNFVYNKAPIWDEAYNIAIWTSNQLRNSYDYWVYPGAPHTYTMCNVGIKTTNPAYALDVVGTGHFTGNTLVDGRLGVGTLAPTEKIEVEGNAQIDGDVYVDVANGGSVYLFGKNVNNSAGYPKYGVGYMNGEVNVGGNEVSLWDTSGKILWTVAASNSTYAYVAPMHAWGGLTSPPAGWDGAHTINNQICPTVVVSCNLRVPGNLAVNTVNAWCYSGAFGQIAYMCNLAADINDLKAGFIRCDNYQTGAGAAFTSDERLKENVEAANLEICYSNVKHLGLKYYRWNDDYVTEDRPDRHALGWIAQHVEKILPKAIHEVDMFGIDDCKTVDQSQILAMLYGTVQKLQNLSESQQETIEKQSRDIAELKSIIRSVIGPAA